MPLDDQTRSAIDELLADNRVVLFMKGSRQQPQCGFSAKTVTALDMLLPEYVTIDVLQYPQVREGIKEYGNWPTIPQLYVAGELLGGSDIVQEMLQSGELADALGVSVPDVDEPQVSVTDGAAEAIRNAVASQPNMALHLQIDAAWNHGLSLSPPKPGSLEVQAGDIILRMDPWSAARANGLKIDMEEQLAGTRFVFDNPNAPPAVQEMTVHDLKAKLDEGDEVLLFDVREDEERVRALIDFARAWDREAMTLIDSLPRDTELVFHCHLGGRSLQAAEHYRRLGYTNVHNLIGGIRAWAEEIDPDVPTY
jgi:monothiol glutaredoxin